MGTHDKQIIIPNRFYSADELGHILCGKVKIETLRACGLVGFASGYWGYNVIDAINRYCENRFRQRGVVRKEDAHVFFENHERAPGSPTQSPNLPSGSIHAASGKCRHGKCSEPVESQRAQLERLLPKGSL